MTDTSVNTRDRFQGAIQRARAALDALRGQLAERVSDIGQDVNTKLDEVQTAIDEIQQAWQERPQPDNTLPGQQPQPTQLPADPAQQGTAQPPADQAAGQVQSQGTDQGAVGNAPQPPGGTAPPV
jgi:ABC-type transporter Mla subunit MlaD